MMLNHLSVAIPIFASASSPQKDAKKAEIRDGRDVAKLLSLAVDFYDI